MLPEKNEEIYNKLLHKVLQLITPGLSCNPATIMTDFEKAAEFFFQMLKLLDDISAWASLETHPGSWPYSKV